jgi:hypothetical protein
MFGYFHYFKPVGSPALIPLNNNGINAIAANNGSTLWFPHVN